MRTLFVLFALWLVNALTVCASGATLTMESCSVAIVQPIGNAGELTLSRSYEKWLRTESNRHRFAHYWTERALDFGKSRDPRILTHETNEATLIKYLPDTCELAVIVDTKIIFYDEFHPNSFASVSPREFFGLLCQAKLRGLEALSVVKPFDRFSRRRHFEDHGEAVAALNEEEYEEAAIYFGTHSYDEGLVMDVVENGRARTIKIDLSTGEFGSFSKRDNAVITYFVKERHAAFYFLSRALPRSDFR